MNIGILGTGNVGKALGRRWCQTEHDVWFGSRTPTPERAAELAEMMPQPVKLVSNETCAAECQVLIIAAPWPVGLELARLVPTDASPIIIDCMNPLSPDLSQLTTPQGSSTAQEIAKTFPHLRVIKAFNCASASAMSDPDFREQTPSMLFCGDDATAKQEVQQLITQCGFEPVDAGALTSAGYLESLALLTIKVAIHNRWGGECALRIMRR